jgi:uncharacterized membrane protein
MEKAKRKGNPAIRRTTWIVAALAIFLLVTLVFPVSAGDPAGRPYIGRIL